MSDHQAHRTEALARRELSTEDALDIESDRRRRVVAAFLLGAEARPDRAALRPWRGVVGGVGLTVAAIVVVGVVAVASTSLAAGRSSTPAVTPAVAVPSMTPSAGLGAAVTSPSQGRP